MIGQDHFIVILPSDVDTNERHPSNNPSSYIVPLAEPLHFPIDQQWEVCMLEIIFPTTIRNVKGASTRVRWRKLDGCEVYTGKFSLIDSTYNADSFCRIVTSKLRKVKQKRRTDDSTIELKTSLKYDDELKRIIFHRGAEEHVFFSTRMLTKIGMPDRKEDTELFTKLFRTSFLEDKKFLLPYPPRFDEGLELMYVYSDIVKYSQVGNTKVPIIRTIYLGSVFGEINKGSLSSVGMEFQHLDFYPVHGNRISEIEVKLCDSYGETINFYGGRTVIKLLFKRVK